MVDNLFFLMTMEIISLEETKLELSSLPVNAQYYHKGIIEGDDSNFNILALAVLENPIDSSS